MINLDFIINFAKEHVELCFSIGAFFIYVLLYFIALFKNKHKEKDIYKNKILSILDQVPVLVKEAESLIGSGHGDVKKKFVLSSIEKLCELININLNDFDFDRLVENILATPIKRGGP